MTFFHELKAAGVPVTLREYLTLVEAVEKGVADRRVDDFYYLSRAALIKDERNLDKFDRVFARVFKGLSAMSEALEAAIPSEWLKRLAEKYLTEEEKRQIEAMGGLDKLLELLRRRLQEQKGRHQGGGKWIGTAGTSPFGAYGFNPEGVPRLIDSEPLLSPIMLALAEWMADYYLCPLGQVLQAIVPAGVRGKAGTRKMTFLSVLPEVREQLEAGKLKLGEKQLDALRILAASPRPLTPPELAQAAKCTLGPIAELRKKKLVKAEVPPHPAG